MPLRCLLGLSAAVSGRLPRSLSTAASRLPWAMVDYTTRVFRSEERRASFDLADPPRTSQVRVPSHVFNPQPQPGVVRLLGGNVRAASGDGLLLLFLSDYPAPAPMFPTHGETWVQARELSGVNLDPDMTRFVCNPLTGELHRLPDMDGTKKTECYRHMGLLTQADHGHGPPDRYVVAEFSGERGGVMRRFLSETGRWDKLVGLSSPVPVTRRVVIDHEAVAFGGRLWWADMSWGAFSVDPFSDEPEFRFVELPTGSVLPADAFAVADREGGILTMLRYIGVSEGRLRYIEVYPEEPFVLSSFVLDDEGSRWILEHRVELSRLWADGGYPWVPLRGTAPWFGVVDPLNANAMYLTVGNHVVGVDIARRVVIGSSRTELDEPTGYLLPCVLPPWLASSRIPSSGKGDLKNETLAEILFRSN